MGLRIVPDADHGGERIGGAKACAGRGLTLDTQGIRSDKSTGAAHRPGVQQEARKEALARGGTAQHDHLAGEQRATRLHLCHGAALEPRALEDNGFLR